MNAALLLAIILTADADPRADDWVCVPAPENRGWLCGQGDNRPAAAPPSADEALAAVDERRPLEAPEITPLPDAHVAVRARPGAPLLLGTMAEEEAAAGAPQEPPGEHIEAGYALLLATLATVADLEDFVSDFEVDPSRAARLPAIELGVLRHLLIFGRFDTPRDAREAAQSLPSILQSMRPAVIRLHEYALQPVPLSGAESSIAATSVPPAPAQDTDLDPPMESDTAISIVAAAEPPEPELTDDVASAHAGQTNRVETSEPADQPAPPDGETQVVASEPTDAEPETDLSPPSPELAQREPARLESAQDETTDGPQTVAAAEPLPTEPEIDTPTTVSPEQADPAINRDTRAWTAYSPSPTAQTAPPEETPPATRPIDDPLGYAQEVRSQPRSQTTELEAARTPPTRARESVPAAPSSSTIRSDADFRARSGRYTIQLASLGSRDDVDGYLAPLNRLDHNRVYAVAAEGRILVLFGRFAKFGDARSTLETLNFVPGTPWVRTTTFLDNAP